MDAAYLFDPALRALRRHRAAREPQEAGFLFHEGAEALADRLSFVARDFMQVAFHGSDFAALPKAFPALAPRHLIEAESEVWPQEIKGADLILSNLQLHWVNDLPGVLLQIRRSLRPDGFFSACLIGGESLFELRASLAEATDRLGLPHRPRISPMIDVPMAAGLMQRAGFALPVVDHEVLNLSYTNPLTLLHDLRAMGQTNALVGQPRGADPRAFWPMVVQAYGDLFPHPEGGVRATFDLIFLSGWAPADTQQQPLKPGSAQMDLAKGLEQL